MSKILLIIPILQRRKVRDLFQVLRLGSSRLRIGSYLVSASRTPALNHYGKTVLLQGRRLCSSDVFQVPRQLLHRTETINHCRMKYNNDLHPGLLVFRILAYLRHSVQLMSHTCEDNED